MVADSFESLSPSVHASDSTTTTDNQADFSSSFTRQSVAANAAETSNPASPRAAPSRLLAGIRGTHLTPIQQAALLQSLLTPRRDRPYEFPNSSPRLASPLSASVEDIVDTLPELPASPPSTLPEDNTQMPYSRIDGLNELQAPPLASSTTTFAERLAPNHLDELLTAQTNLDIWASTVFSAGSPGFLTPPAYPEVAPALHSSVSSETSTLPGMVVAQTPFDWSTLYPQPPGGLVESPSSSLPHLHPTGLPAFQLPQPPFHSPFPSVPPSHISTLPQKTSERYDEAGTEPSSRAASPAPSRPSRSRRASKAPSRSASDGGQGSDTPSLAAAKEFMTPEEVEEDKRRRNTEASARFRAKKKQRNVALQQTAAQLREKVAELEKEKEALTSQNRWLRDIISEKAEGR